MKRFLVVVFGILLVAGSVQAQEVVAGSAHDFSSAGPGANVDTTQTCVFCHTPHQDTGTLEPLWNHTDPAAVTYTAYTSTTMDHTAVAFDSGTSDVSSLCMSCHDGTVAITNLHNPPNDWTPTISNVAGTNVSATGFLTGAGNLGTTLANEHPINFTIADGTDSEIDTVANISAALPLFGTADIQCASCHDPHGSPISEAPLLTVTMDASALCTTCHIK